MKKFYLVLILLVLGLTLTASQAMAFQLTMNGAAYTGPIKFKYSNWDQGALYDINYNADNLQNGTTDSYGIASVSSIQGKNTLGNWVNVWTPSATEAIEGVFYGLDDNAVHLSNGTGSILSVGGTLEFYLGTPNLNPAAGPATTIVGLGRPTDSWNAMDGTLFLSANFVPGITADGVTTYSQTVTSITQPISGGGIGYLSITGGAYQSLFDTNGFLNGAADLRLQSDFKGYDPNNATYNDTLGWTATSDDPVDGRAAVPEPASMLLLGMGLVGIALKGKKKVA